MNTLIVGIDVGKNTHYATVINQQGAILGGSIKFANTTKGGELLLERIQTINPDGHSLVFGLEATGHYWLALYSFLSKHGYPVHVINPYQSDAWRKIYLSTTKTDQEDAFLIADIIRFGSFSETKLADAQIISLRNFTRFRVGLSQQLSETKVRIITILDQIFPEFDNLFSNTLGKTAKALLTEHPTPEAIVELSVEDLTLLVTKASRGRFGKDKAKQIKQSADNSFGITFAMDSFTFQLHLLLEQLEFLQQQLATVDQQIGTLMVSVDSKLLTIPGVEVTLAACIHAEIGDIHRFSTSNQLVSYAGLDPTTKQSGKFRGTKNRMSKKGSPYLRLALWRAAMLSTRFNPQLREYYQNKVAEGKPKMKAIGAVARKLTLIIFAILKHDQPYQADSDTTLKSVSDC